MLVGGAHLAFCHGDLTTLCLSVSHHGELGAFHHGVQVWRDHTELAGEARQHMHNAFYQAKFGRLIRRQFLQG